MLSVRVDGDLEKQVDYVAKLSKRSKSSIVKQLLQENLDDLQDYYVALECLAEQKEKGERTYTLEEVKKELELDDE